MLGHCTQCQVGVPTICSACSCRDELSACHDLQAQLDTARDQLAAMTGCMREVALRLYALSEEHGDDWAEIAVLSDKLLAAKGATRT